MKRTLKITLGAAATAALTVAAVTVAGSAGGLGPAPQQVSTGLLIGVGRIQIEATSTGPRVALYAPGASTPSKTRPIQLDNRCRITNLTQVGELLKFEIVDTATQTTSTADLRFVENGFGAATNGNCSTGNGRVGPGKALRITLGTDFTSTPTTVTSTVLNIEGKFSADMTYQTSNGGTPSGTTYTVDLANASDNGADSGGRDNSRVSLPDTTLSLGGTPFTAIELRPSGSRAEIALDNGGDSADLVGPTVFTLSDTFEYSVDCTGTGSVTSETFDNPTTTATDEGGTVDQATFTRRANKDGSPCKLIGLNLSVATSGSAGSLFDESGAPRDVITINPTSTAADGTPQNVRATVEIVWLVPRWKDADGTPGGALAPRTAAEINAELARQIIYPDGPDTDTLEDRYLMTYCTQMGGTGEEITGAGSDYIGHEDTQPWCMTSDNRSVVTIDGTTYIRQVVTLDVNGDPKAM